MYGKLYLERKAYEQKRNDNGDLAATAAERLKQAKQKKLDAGLIELFVSGKLPAMALHERAKRWAVKVFLAHYHAAAQCSPLMERTAAPVPIAHLGHAHLIKGPSVARFKNVIQNAQLRLLQTKPSFRTEILFQNRSFCGVT